MKVRAKAKIQVGLIILCSLTLSGCVSLGPKEIVKEIEFTRVKMGTPAYVVNEAGKPQIVRAQVMGQDGKLSLGKIDANGMVLIDEPTLDYYRALHAKTREMK
jgi:hypothetical protein